MLIKFMQSLSLNSHIFPAIGPFLLQPRCRSELSRTNPSSAIIAPSGMVSVPAVPHQLQCPPAARGPQTHPGTDTFRLGPTQDPPRKGGGGKFRLPSVFPDISTCFQIFGDRHLVGQTLKVCVCVCVSEFVASGTMGGKSFCAAPHFRIVFS